MLFSETLVHARNADWSPTEQLRHGMEILNLSCPTGNKFSIPIKGDSFTNHPIEYLEAFFTEIYDFFSMETSRSLDEARKKYDAAQNQCMFISVSTRPNMITEQWCIDLIRLGVSSVELGVQNLCDTVLAFNDRGHGSDAVIKATRLLKEHGFEVGYHMMPGLPSATPEIDAANYIRWLWEDIFYPDYIKFYPCVLLKDTDMQPELLELLDSGQWEPLTDESYPKLLDEVLPHIPQSVFISRFQRIIPEEYIAYGPAKYINRSNYNNLNLCIAQRSFQHTAHMNEPFSKLHYHLEDVAQGRDICIQALLPDDTVVGYLRLSFLDELAMVRNVRVLGYPFVFNDDRNTQVGCIQHCGIGKALLNRAELVAKEQDLKGIRIYPAPGTKGYFIKQGYRVNSSSFLIKRFEGE